MRSNNFYFINFRKYKRKKKVSLFLILKKKENIYINKNNEKF